MGRWTVLEEIVVADCALDLEANDLDDLFATAARAVADVMVDPATVTRAVERTLELSAPALDLLLYDWLSELIALKDSDRLVFPWAEVRVRPGPPSTLTARLEGGPIDADTALRADAKAVTLHLFALERRDGGWRARVVLDI